MILYFRGGLTVKLDWEAGYMPTASVLLTRAVGAAQAQMLTDTVVRAFIGRWCLWVHTPALGC